MPPRVYIDGHVGTTGLRIREWLAGRTDIELVSLPEGARKDVAARREQIRGADVAVLCLPDDAAREAVEWAVGAGTRIIDASTAHRVAEGWVYGLPEISAQQREAIRGARLVSNPGCYPTAAILLLRPLIDAGLIAADAPISIHALSGYTGGGRPLIERWEDPALGLSQLPHEAPYSLDKVHKHIPEMTVHSGMRHAPYFIPAVGPFRCGMRVEIPLPATLLSRASAGDCWQALSDRYAGQTFVRVMPCDGAPTDEQSFDPQRCNDTNRIELSLVPHPSGHALLVAILDNLGKGASGAAIQSLNLMLELPESTGLPA